VRLFRAPPSDAHPHVVGPCLVLLLAGCRSFFVAAALGLNAAELQAFLAQQQVCYTFARAEFIPDPEANLIRVSRALVPIRWI
ncbi:unnamed protein product, partial [Ectocarpus sp. 12 AP-2014]